MWILIKLLYYPAVPGFFKSWLIWVNTGGRLEISWWLMQSPCTLYLCSDACLACWLWQNAIWWLPDKQATQCTQNTEFLYCPASTYIITYHAWYSWQAKTPLKNPHFWFVLCFFSACWGFRWQPLASLPSNKTPLGNGANMRKFCCFKLVLAAVVYANEPCCCGDACKAPGFLDHIEDVEIHVADKLSGLLLMILR